MIYAYDRVFYQDTEISKLYHGSTLVWERPFDNSHITVVRYENGQMLRELETFDNVLDSKEYMISNPRKMYYVNIGSSCGITELGTDSTNRFSGVSNLMGINMPAIVENIGDYCFLGCSELSVVILSTGISSIGFGTFKNCSKLGVITIPSNINAIADDAFEGIAEEAIISIRKPEDSITGAPWGATNATIIWTG